VVVVSVMRIVVGKDEDIGFRYASSYLCIPCRKHWERHRDRMPRPEA
jgi:hypothetical protein